MSQEYRPLVSIVIPVYNAEKYLGQCMESILSQSYENFEAICIDDGSSDGSFDLLGEYASRDARVRVFRQENAGPGVARNNGIEKAAGEYLYFFDADDFCDAGLLEKAVRRLLDTEADMVVFPFVEYSEEFGIARRPSWGLLGDKFSEDVFSWRDNPDWIFEAFHNFPWNKIVKTDFVRRNKIKYQDIYLTEDLMYSAPCLLLADRVAWIDEPLVSHRIATGTNVMAHKDAHPLDFLTAFLSLKGFLEENGLYDDLRVAFSNWALNGCAYNLHTLNSLDGFRLVYRTLADSGARDLGLFELEDDRYRDKDQLSLLHSLERESAEEYLYRRYVLAREGRDSLDFLARCRLDGLVSLEKELEETRGRMADIESDFERYRDMHRKTMNAAEQRIGGLICYIPRVVQRWVLRRKNGR